MPPKANSRPYQHPPPPPLSSPLSLSTAADVLHSREHFSIASFFDAASARRSGGVGGGGYRLSSSAAPTIAPVAPVPPPSSPSSHAHAAAAASSHHWSTTASPGVASAFGSSSATHAASSPSTAGDVSSTLQEVRRRIISDLAAAQDGSRESASRLQAHRQRALRVAFGEHGSAHKPSSRSGRGNGVADVAGTSPSDSRRSKSQHTPDADGGGGDDEDELMVASVEFSLLCPYSRLPMRYPVRSKDCNHLQCCDVDSWVVMLDKCRSMRDPVGPCPVCERRVLSSSLEVDVWMKNVMDQMPAGTHMVVLEADGTFRNGDTTREKRKEQVTMEVVDATQGDFENYLGDVVEDDEDAVVAVAAHPSPSHPHAATTSLSASIFASGVRRQRSPSPAEVARRADRAATTAAVAPTPTSTSARGGPPPLVQVKAEKAAAAAAADAPPEASTSPAESPSQEDGGVVVVHFVEGRHDGRQALPSQIRLWVPHCAKCGAPKVKAENTAAADGCAQCGHNGKDDWHLVRRFEASSAVLMELTADGTLVLHGVDALAPYLYRAGFHRSLFEVMEYASVAEQQQWQYRAPTGVWVSSFPLSRFEVDFLEACCARVAQGDPLDAIDALIVPSLFRIPRRRRLGNGAATPFTQQQSGNYSHSCGGSGGAARGTLSAAWAASSSQAHRPTPFA